MLKEYRVEWSMYFDGVNIYDAVRQAQAALDDAINGRGGATVFLVNEKYDEHRVQVDLDDMNNQNMIGSGWCDECGEPYAAASNSDHCAEEGLCWRHCTAPNEH